MDLVTVTCNRDFQQMLLQAESIQKFVNPCTHWIVVNEKITNVEVWKSMVSKYYTRHKSVLLFPSDFKNVNLTDSGWHSQQYYKLKIAEMLTDDYVVLDSKNFFIDNCNIDDWRNVVGSGQKVEWSSAHSELASSNIANFLKCSHAYARIMKTDVMPNFLKYFTPFVIKRNILVESKYFSELEKYLFVDDVLPSEFIFYSYLLKDHPNYVDFVSERLCHRIYNEGHESDNEIFNKRIKNIKVLGIKPAFLHEKNILWLNKFLTQTGFKFQFDMLK